MSTHWAGVSWLQGRRRWRLPRVTLSFLEPSPALCKGRHSEHLISCILIITYTLSSSLQKERKTPSPPPDSSQHTCLSISTPAQSSPASTQCPCPYHRKPLQLLGTGLQCPFMYPRSLKLASTIHSNAFYPSFLIFDSHWESSVL